MEYIKIPECTGIKIPKVSLDDIMSYEPHQIQKEFTLSIKPKEIQKGVHLIDFQYFLSDRYTGYSKVTILPEDGGGEKAVYWDEFYPREEGPVGQRYGTYCQFATLLKLIEKGFVGIGDDELHSSNLTDQRLNQLRIIGVDDGIIEENLVKYANNLEEIGYVLRQENQALEGLEIR